MVARLNVKRVMLSPTPCRPQDEPRVGGPAGKLLSDVGIRVVADDGSGVPTGEKTAGGVHRFFQDELPRNAMGKVQKNVLRYRHEKLFLG